MTPEKIAWLRYQCRRGMLELDAILQPFFERYFLQLSPTEQQLFERLLESNDQELYMWFIGHEKPDNQDLLAIINTIKKYLPVV